MVSLAQVDPEADLTGQSTIMNLSKDSRGVAGLTGWDRDYLAALYDAPADRANARRQEDAVAGALGRQRREQDGLPVEDPE